mmetsp:Transcript_15958/g.29640  ORF Transcript_15958/g.29640 Transcript_15958/m.29640 type:complete len:120 (-) Transcript_15958:844-1203(-)
MPKVPPVWSAPQATSPLTLDSRRHQSALTLFQFSNFRTILLPTSRMKVMDALDCGQKHVITIHRLPNQLVLVTMVETTASMITALATGRHVYQELGSQKTVWAFLPVHERTQALLSFKL